MGDFDFDRYIKENVTYNPDTGVLFRKDLNKEVVCRTSYGYIRLIIKRKEFAAGRVAWFLTHGRWPDNCIDHINGVRDDNRLCNLRDVSYKQNSQNQKVHRQGSLVGVTYREDTKKWRAVYYVNGVQYSAGQYSTKEEARLAVEEAEKTGGKNLTPPKRRDPEMKGICFHKRSKKYQVKIGNKYLGYFKTLEEAKIARDKGVTND